MQSKDNHNSPSWSLSRLLLGRPLPNREAKARKLGPFEGVPAMGLDGLSSSAYGPEAALAVLAPAGAASLAWLGWVDGADTGAAGHPLRIVPADASRAYPATAVRIPYRGRTRARPPVSSPRPR